MHTTANLGHCVCVHSLWFIKQLIMLSDVLDKQVLGLQQGCCDCLLQGCCLLVKSHGLQKDRQNNTCHTSTCWTCHIRQHSTRQYLRDAVTGWLCHSWQLATYG